MAHKADYFTFKITPERFVYYLWLVRCSKNGFILTAGICCALSNIVVRDRTYPVPADRTRMEYATDVAKVMYYTVLNMDITLKYSDGYLFRPYQWQERKQFLDDFIAALCKKYNLTHPSKTLI
jgi:hypothetical protein